MYTKTNKSRNPHIPLWLQDIIPLTTLNTDKTGMIDALSKVQGSRCAFWTSTFTFYTGIYYGWCIEAIYGKNVLFDITLGGRPIATAVNYYNKPFFLTRLV
uniref:Uncharacterized protein n=1 Tax=viral metagenome TaxID=1070528 RepID=A0A6C0J597_9ZZZZ